MGLLPSYYLLGFQKTVERPSEHADIATALQRDVTMQPYNDSTKQEEQPGTTRARELQAAHTTVHTASDNYQPNLSGP